jgi:hypothetical protein
MSGHHEPVPGCARLAGEVSCNAIHSAVALAGDAIGGRGVFVAIDIAHEAGGYSVSVSPPHSSQPWQSRRLLTATEVLEELSARGCHSTDATDALYMADANWVVNHDAEVRRRRETGAPGPAQQAG